MRTHPSITIFPAFSAWVVRRARMATARCDPRPLVAGALVLAVPLAGCMTDPAAPLIPTPDRQATVLPTEVRALDPDGYPNVLSDPSPVAGLPRTQRSIAASEAALDAERRASQAEVAGIRGSNFAGELARRGRVHAAEARRAIEATGRPSVPGVQDAALRELPSGPGATAPSEGAASQPTPSRPLDPNEPRPRPVGVPPFRGEPNDG
ncbi:MAG: hypothetical protein AAGF49_12255 [Pseudomonadota bacterium]